MLIPAEGGPTEHANYQYLDADVQPGTTYYYKLEDVDTNGRGTFHFPTLVSVSTVTGKSHFLFLPSLLKSLNAFILEPHHAIFITPVSSKGSPIPLEGLAFLLS